jgi:hypothetical protein
VRSWFEVTVQFAGVGVAGGAPWSQCFVRGKLGGGRSKADMRVSLGLGLRGGCSEGATAVKSSAGLPSLSFAPSLLYCSSSSVSSCPYFITDSRG